MVSRSKQLENCETNNHTQLRSGPSFSRLTYAICHEVKNGSQQCRKTVNYLLNIFHNSFGAKTQLKRGCKVSFSGTKKFHYQYGLSADTGQKLWIACLRETEIKICVYKIVFVQWWSRYTVKFYAFSTRKRRMYSGHFQQGSTSLPYTFECHFFLPDSGVLLKCQLDTRSVRSFNKTFLKHDFKTVHYDLKATKYITGMAVLHINVFWRTDLVLKLRVVLIKTRINEFYARKVQCLFQNMINVGGRHVLFFSITNYC